MEILFLCIKIFLARICDVSIGTVRTVVTIKGKPVQAAMLAFLEVFIWFNIAREALKTDLVSWWIPIAYSAGFATGTLIGIVVSKKMIKGVVGVQAVTMKLTKEMIAKIREEGFAVSISELYSEEEAQHKDMLYLQINNRNLQKLTKLLKSLDPNAFIAVSETKYVQNGFIK